jgi:chromosome segregation protein
VRLQSIKLSGFKSFVEPTNFVLPGQLVGVVGPNGCGKSNIMDAVRWVLGESKASELRGESMQDVIFNGTNTRKPASRASVELVFDNADHRAGGQWSQFSEIAVRRVLTREGNSSYFINNQLVRRRDVQDVFLGTGLGPRAYAIIGQGTISRIIESKPEELRLFLEEAAGVSKYKERRRETANRLNDTRENLTRVEDILRELNANLNKLERQAEVAAQYQSLQANASLKQQQLWFLKRQDAQNEQARLAEQAQANATELESSMADLRRLEAEIEVVRQAHYAAGDSVNQAQGKLYEASAEVGKLEAEIRFVVEGRARAEQRLAQLVSQHEQWLTQRTTAGEELENLDANAEAAQEQAAILEAQVEEQAQVLPTLEEQLRQAQSKANEQRGVVTQVQQQIQVLAAEQRGLEEQARQGEARRERLGAERNAVQAPDAARLNNLVAQHAQAAEQHSMNVGALDELQTAVPELDEARKTAQSNVSQQGTLLAQHAARLQALKALQDKLQTNDKLQPWLAKHGLEHLQPLWQQIQVQSGWETALEAVLRERLAALPVGQLNMVKGFAADAPASKLTFLAASDAQAAGASAQAAMAAPAGFKPLIDKVSVSDAGIKAVLTHWLSGCFVANSLGEALVERAQLGAGQYLVATDGHVVGPHSVSFYANDSEQAGMLARAQEIENLDKQVRAQSLINDEARAALVRAEADYANAAQQLVQLRANSNESQNRVHELQVEVLRLTQASEQAAARSTQLEGDLQELDAALEDIQERKAASQARFEELDMQLGDTQERHAQLDDQVIHHQRQLDAAREQQRSLERQMQEASFSTRSLGARRDELTRMLKTATEQLLGIDGERERATEELARLSDAAAQGGLQDALALKMQREEALGVQRSAYDDLTNKLRASDERRLQIERALDPIRARITDMQLKEQAARLGVAQYTQQLEEAQADLAMVSQSITEGNVRLMGLQSEIERIHREIAALGAVNLAALEELSASRERKEFLDAQMADLLEAIQTLEDAIAKIDAETRELLGSTFATVNEHFGRMFPELFGGGNAKLVMTGDEILDAGVQVMAHPPGKKNQTIHLLSGGEKALTAIALVFAIFQLNPAPFCLLDEVDAPLDDANTERYAKLVSAMSASTQFLFISHNKIAMEMAKQLIGVTMQEQGVSRIVAVDMESAANLVA